MVMVMVETAGLSVHASAEASILCSTGSCPQWMLLLLLHHPHLLQQLHHPLLPEEELRLEDPPWVLMISSSPSLPFPIILFLVSQAITSSYLYSPFFSDPSVAAALGPPPEKIAAITAMGFTGLGIPQWFHAHCLPLLLQYFDPSSHRRSSHSCPRPDRQCSRTGSTVVRRQSRVEQGERQTKTPTRPK